MKLLFSFHVGDYCSDPYHKREEAEKNEQQEREREREGRLPVENGNDAHPY